MKFFRIYGRVLGLLAPEKGLATTLALANLALAGLQFVEPVLFGRVIDVLSGAGSKNPDRIWAESFRLLAIWAAVGVGGIVANIAVALHSDRMAHRERLAAMAHYFEH